MPIKLKFKNYSVYSNLAEEVNGTTHGGVSIFIKRSTPHKQVHLITSLQAVAIRATLHKAKSNQITFIRFWQP